MKAESSLDRHMTTEVEQVIKNHKQHHEGEEEDVVEVTADILENYRLNEGSAIQSKSIYI